MGDIFLATVPKDCARGFYDPQHGGRGAIKEALVILCLFFVHFEMMPDIWVSPIETHKQHGHFLRHIDTRTGKQWQKNIDKTLF